MRTNAETGFEKIFQAAQHLTEIVGGDDIAVPRIVARQTCRANIPAANTTEYYRQVLYVPFLDFLISELRSRFNAHADILSSLQGFLPEHTDNVNDDHIEMCTKFYTQLLPDPTQLSSEMTVWKQKWCSVPEAVRQMSTLESFISCTGDFFPNVKTIFGILTTLPVSTATAERSLLTLKRLKTYLRNSMGDNRLSGLALFSILREINVDPSEVLERFAKTPRRCKLLL
jgi:hypothetical protein